MSCPRRRGSDTLTGTDPKTATSAATPDPYGVPREGRTVRARIRRFALPLAFAVAGAVATPAVASSPSAAAWSARAHHAYTAMQQYLYGGSANQNLYRENYPVQSGD